MTKEKREGKIVKLTLELDGETIEYDVEGQSYILMFINDQDNVESITHVNRRYSFHFLEIVKGTLHFILNKIPKHLMDEYIKKSNDLFRLDEEEVAKRHEKVNRKKGDIDSSLN